MNYQIEYNLISHLFGKKKMTLVQNVVICIFSSILIGIVSQVSIALFFSPVPITLQSLVVVMMGSILGAKRALFTIFLYLFEGAVGLPFFAGGSFGLSVLIGPTGGYLIGFLISATTMGYFSDRKYDREFKFSYFQFFFGHFLIFIPGCIWLSIFVGFENSIIQGLIPFLPGLIVKSIIAGYLLPVLWNMKKRN